MFLMQEFFILLTSNVLFTKLLGTDILYFAKKNKKSFLVLATYISIFTLICSMITFFTDKFVAGYLIALVDIAIVITLYIIGFGISKLFGSKAFSLYKGYMHFGAINTAVMGILFFNTNTSDFKNHMIFAVESVFGLFIAIWMINMVYDFLSSKDVPKCFRGYPALLIYTGIVSMALYSFNI